MEQIYLTWCTGDIYHGRSGAVDSAVISWSVGTGPNATMVDNGCKTASLGQGHELGSAVDRGTAHLTVAGIPIPFRL